MAVLSTYRSSSQWFIWLRFLVQLDASSKLLKCELFESKQAGNTKCQFDFVGWPWLHPDFQVQQLIRSYPAVATIESIRFAHCRALVLP
jgi:hypothetical protein